jgi:haloalkane dehalogenase
MIAPLVEAGHRVLLFDQVGCGRSDKPDQEEDYTYERHIGWNIDLLVNHLHVKNATILLQDWGGLLGLRVVAAHPGRFDRLVIANTMMPTCDDEFFKVSPGFYSWSEQPPPPTTVTKPTPTPTHDEENFHQLKCVAFSSFRDVQLPHNAQG